MCKWYSVAFACLCAHDLKVVKPCACYAKRSAPSINDRVCDIWQAAKEPIILKDHCASCSSVGRRQTMAAPGQQAFGGHLAAPPARQAVGGRYYESTDVSDMPTVSGISHGEVMEDFAVLEPQAFDSMFKLVETLPSLDGKERQAATAGAEESVSVDQQAHGKHVMPKPTFSREMVDRSVRR